MNRVFSFITLQIIILVALSAGISAQGPPASDRLDEADLVHFGDIVEVDVIGSFEYDWRGSLDGDGFLAGYDAYDSPIAAVCRRESEIAADVAKALSKFLRAPIVNVRIIDRSGRALARLEGAVRTPTRFMIKRSVHLRELLVLAGGIAEGADGKITIFRRTDLGCSQLPDVAKEGALRPLAKGSFILDISIAELLQGDKGSDPEIKGGDLVTVSKAQPVFLIGGVNKLSPLYVRSDMTVSRAIAMAGGLVKNADASRVTLSRKDKGEIKTIELNLRKIDKGDQKDEILRPFDILEVALKGGEKRKFPLTAPANVARVASSELPLRIIE